MSDLSCSQANPFRTLGFLLSSRCLSSETSTQLEYWFATDSGPVKCTIDQLSICFIQQDQQERAERLAKAEGIYAEFRVITLKNFHGQLMTACYLHQSQIFAFQNLLADWDIHVWEGDLRATDRYLMERFICGTALIAGDGSSADSNRNFISLEQPRLKAADYQPKLSMLSIDIETSFPRKNQPDRLFSIGYYGIVHNQLVQKVIMIGEVDTGDERVSEPWLQLVEDEEQLLHQFLEDVEDIDPDVIIGWNFVQFDLVFLRKKFEEYDIEFSLGRDREAITWRQDRNKPDRFYVHVPGRCVFDGIELLRQAEYHFESFALDNVADQLLQRGKLLHGQDRGGDIEHLFDEDKQALADYNLEDCKLVWDIFEKTDLLNFAIQRSKITGLIPDRMGGSVAAFENLYLPHLHRAGFVAPNMGEGFDGVKSPGGYVMDSVPGFYQSVLVLDFKSLYPSIIRTFKIDPMGLITGLAESDEQSVIEGFNGGLFHRQHNKLPELIEQLWQKRDQAKQHNNFPLSQAIKIIMSSFYGVLGSTGCRFFDVRLSSSITQRSHQIIQQTSDWIEAQGFPVIYGDTDSVFVSLGEAYSQQEADKLGSKLAQQLNQYWQQRIQQEFQLESFLEIEYETHYQQFFMPSIRGEEKGSKKRYAGLIVKDQPEIIFKGLEAVRTDWTLLARHFQQEFFEYIFHQQDYHQWMTDYVEDMFAGKLDDQMIYRKRLRRPISDYQKNIPPHAQAARKLEAYRQLQGLQPLYELSGGWIQYVMTLNGAEPIEHVTAPLDYHHYFERQLMPIADSVLMFFKESFAEICGQQQSLF